jgi:UDPglucose 6-dehydrogenase
VLLEKIDAHFGGDLKGRRFAVFGLSFKPDTDDMREAPSRVIVPELLRAGAQVVAHDPIAREQAQRALQEDLAREPHLLAGLRYVDKPMEALDGADALVLVTEWRNYRTLNLAALKRAMRTPLVFDGRNLYDPHQFAAAGVACIGIGRSNLHLLKEDRHTERQRVAANEEAVAPETVQRARRPAGAVRAAAG